MVRAVIFEFINRSASSFASSDHIPLREHWSPSIWRYNNY
nr:MAG TPA: hypothetical protein [Caudoviricetes sp.]